MQTSVETLERPASGTQRQRVAVLGLGFVGAANAIAIASARGANGAPRFEVVGVELPTPWGQERAGALNEGRFPFATTDEELVRVAGESREAGNLGGVTSPEALGDAEVVVVDIGLDLELESKKGEEPQFARAPFEAAIRTVGDNADPEALILLESTVPPGTCEKIVMPILRERFAARGATAEPKLAYCYERVMPGSQYLQSVRNIWRVYAGATPAVADEAEAFLSAFIDVSAKPLTRLESLRAAEMAKVLENTYRAVNIALIDEWERFARAIDIDLYGVLDAIRVRPTHNNIRFPGLGVGGYCLSKDPMFGPASAREIWGLEGLKFPLSTAGVRINDAMPTASADLLEQVLGGLSGKRVLLLGAAYRQDVGDTRLSPSATLAQDLLARGAVVAVADPMVDEFPEADVPLHGELPDASGFDAVALCVPHTAWRGLDLAGWAGAARPAIVDTNGMLDAGKLAALKAAGFTVAAIGRGTI